MKKVLLATTALIAFGTVSAQAADPIKLTIGGYMKQWVGVAGNQDGKDYSSLATYTNGNAATEALVAPASQSNANRVAVDQQSDTNINFVGATKLDNGISVAVEVDTFGTQRQDSRNVNYNVGKDAKAGNSDVKRSFMTVSGAFGAVIAGQREDVGYIVHNSAPDVGIGLQDGDWFNWMVAPTGHAVYTATNASRYDDRSDKITYVTPAFYGLAAGVTYAPNISMATSGTTTTPSSLPVAQYAHVDTTVNGADFGGSLAVAGLAYANTFGDVKVTADAGVGQAQIANLRVYQGGLQVGYAGFVVGGSIFNRQVNDHANVAAAYVNSAATSTVPFLGNSAAKAAAYAGQSWDLGVSYTTGPYAVSLGYFHDNTDTVTGGLARSAADSTDVTMLSAAYAMGPGVSWKNSVFYTAYNSGIENGFEENKGWTAVTGIRVDF